jgi:hypothetical protein
MFLSESLHALLNSHIQKRKGCPCPSLSTTPWRCIREWRYSSTFLKLGNIWWVISFTPRTFYPLETADGTQWTACWVVSKVGMHTVKKQRKRKTRSLPGIELRFLGHSTWHLAIVPTEKMSLHNSVSYMQMRSQWHVFFFPSASNFCNWLASYIPFRFQ